MNHPTDDDLDAAMRDLGGPVTTSPDADTLWARGRRRRGRTQIGAGMGVVALVAAGVFAITRPTAMVPAIDIVSDPGETSQPGDPAAREPVEGIPFRVLSAYNGGRGQRGEATWVADPDTCPPNANCVTQTPYEELWQTWGVPGTLPPVIDDPDAWIVVAFAYSDDGCPEEVTGVAVSGDLISPPRVDVTLTPPPGGCIQPLVTSSHVVALHRSALPPEFTLHALPPYVFDGESAPTVRVQLSGSQAIAPFEGDLVSPSAGPPTEVRGTVAVPSEEAVVAAGSLDDGTPVWAVNLGARGTFVLAADHDGPGVYGLPEGGGTDGEGGEDEGEGGSGSVTGLGRTVKWFPGFHRFSGAGGWFDARGVSWAGEAQGGLDVYESRVVGDRIEVGRRLGPFDLNRARQLHEIADDGDQQRPLAAWSEAATVIDIDDLAGVRDGQVVLVDASVVVDRDRPIQLCDVPEAPAVWEWDGCPDDAPIVQGADRTRPTPNSFTVLRGPVQVRVVDGRPTDVVLVGGGTESGTR